MENNKISSLEVGALSTFIYKAFIIPMQNAVARKVLNCRTIEADTDKVI